MKKSQSISRKPKQKKRKTIKEGIFLPKESKWEWFILGFFLFIGILTLIYMSNSTLSGQTDYGNRTTSTLFVTSIILIMSIFLGYTFFKNGLLMYMQNIKIHKSFLLMI